MRLMLWSLLALNGVAAALWLAGVKVPAASHPAVPPPALTAQRLELLSELPSPPPRLGAQDDALPQAPSPESTPAAVETVAPSPLAPEVPKPEGVVATNMPAPAVEEALPPPVSASPPVSGMEPAAAKAATATEPKPEPKPIVPAPLVAPTAPEVAPAPATPQTPTSKSGKPATASDAPDRVACYRTTEFAPDARERVEAALQKAGLTPADIKSSVRPRYWVYWSGAPAAAGEVEQALKAAGVKDWYRVGGGREATLSLGVYGQADGARRRQRELAGKGIQAAVAERYATQARQRWQVKTSPAAVESARATLASAGVRLEACP